MDEIGANDCNSKELARMLVGSIQRLLNLNQWNDFVRHQAIEDPHRFIEDVAKLADVLEKEDESKGGVHFRLTGVTPEGSRDKIACIKAMRGMFGWGLADSKTSFERLPGSGHLDSKAGYTIISPEFASQTAMEESMMWKDFLSVKSLFSYDIVRLPAGTLAIKPAQYPA